MDAIRRSALRTAKSLAAAALCLGLLTGATTRGAAKDDAPADDRSAPAPIPTDPHVIVLFSGKQEEVAANWMRPGSDQPPSWQVKDGGMVTSKSNIVTKQKFKDFQLHVDFKVPYMPKAHGQERGNSGVKLLGIYEIQILDSYGFKDPGSGDCGAVYSQFGPLVNACKPPLAWQSFDISFRAPRFDPEGKVTEKARVTVFLNDVCVQNGQEINGATGNAKGDVKDGPILLQFHNNTVQFRNVWIVPLPEEGVKRYEPK
jgi:hypothetical protein